MPRDLQDVDGVGELAGSQGAAAELGENSLHLELGVRALAGRTEFRAGAVGPVLPLTLALTVGLFGKSTVHKSAPDPTAPPSPEPSQRSRNRHVLHRRLGRPGTIYNLPAGQSQGAQAAEILANVSHVVAPFLTSQAIEISKGIYASAKLIVDAAAIKGAAAAMRQPLVISISNRAAGQRHILPTLGPSTRAICCMSRWLRSGGQAELGAAGYAVAADAYCMARLGRLTEAVQRPPPQDLPHGRRPDRHAELGQFAVDAAMSPQRILLCQVNDQAGNALDRRRAAGLTPLGGRLLGRRGRGLLVGVIVGTCRIPVWRAAARSRGLGTVGAGGTGFPGPAESSGSAVFLRPSSARSSGSSP